MFGIIDFSRALYAYHWVSYAAREGSRWASVRGTSSCPGVSQCNATTAQIQSYVQSIVAPGMLSQACSGNNAGCITVTTSWVNTNAAPLSGPDCTNGSGVLNGTPGCIVKVQVSYIFGFSLPFLLNRTGTTMNLQSTSQMVVEQ